MNKLVDCQNCGWTHFEVSADYVRNWELNWLRYFNDWSAERLELYGVTTVPPSTEDEYLRCQNCSGYYLNFEDSSSEKITELTGHTISGILNRKEKL